MAVVTEKWSDRPLTRTATGYEADKVFEVSEVGNDRDMAINAVPFTLGSSHPESALLRASSITADTPKGPLLWEVRVRFSSDATGAEGTDPLTWKTKWRWVPSTETTPTDRDIFDNVRANAVGIPFDQLGQQFDGTMNLIATRNEPFYDAAKALTVQNTTNSAAFNVNSGSGPATVQVGQAMVMSMTCASEVTQDSQYVSVEYNIKFKRGRIITEFDEYDSFFDVRLNVGDAGYMYLDGGEIGIGLFCNKDGMIIGNTLLDITGIPLNDDVVIMSLPPDGTLTIGIPLPVFTIPEEVGIQDFGDRVYLCFRQYAQYDFSDLSL